MRKKSSLSFGEQKTSPKGVFSIIMGVLSIIAALVLIIISGAYRGNAPEAVGACGIVAVAASIIGIIFSVSGAIEREINPMPSYVGFIINIIITIAWVCLFVIGM